MRVGIITIHRASNYGAVLQAYALKNFIKELGYDAELIDYRCTSIEEMYTKMFGSMFSLKSKIKNLLTWSVQLERNKKFMDFINKDLNCTEDTSCYRAKQLEECNDQYDVFISGSDQIWNPFCTGEDKHYFLDFVKDNKRKYSYAASFGTAKQNFIENADYRELLEMYQEISVREKNGIDVIKTMTGKDALLHLDPTFLISKEKWIEKAKSVENINRKPYVLVYSIAMPQSIQKIAEEYAQKSNIDIYYITLNNLFAIKNRKKTITCSPIEFLNWIMNAECVITNSFHGIAFSIIFNKKFYVEKNANPNHDNSRLENILDCLGLQDRFVVNGSIEELNSNIDYTPVNDKIEKIRKKSVDYIRSIDEQFN